MYASSQLGSGQSSQGFTLHANLGKGSSTETTTTHTNTQVAVVGTIYNNITGNFTLDGANLNATHLAGTVGGDLIVNSRQDTYQYTHDQKHAGGSVDIGFDGKPQSMSIHGGKTDVDADYAQVTHQSGIKANSSTLAVQGQGKFTGGYLITDANQNHTSFKQGIQTQDIHNHLNYQGDSLQAGITIDNKAVSLTGLGYGKITPTHKTSTTHSAITDQAALSHINTDNFKQTEVQNQLNSIISNDFNKEQVLTELNAQTVMTTEFGKEAPKAVASFAQSKQIELLTQGNIQEAKKWAEGGVYRVALHSATAALATGNIKGVVSAGTTAYAIPQIDSHLEEQGFDKQTRQTALLTLSASLGTSIGNSTASTVNNVGQVQWNYLAHKELQAKIIELNACGFEKSCIDMVNKKYNEISRTNDIALQNTCRTISANCINQMKNAFDYVGENRHLALKTDVEQSRKRVLDVANASGYHAISNLEMRADYFGAMYEYTGQPWFRAAEKHSRGSLRLMNLKYPEWIAEAGRVIMAEGQKDFIYIYQNHKYTDFSWSARRLHAEQDNEKLQKIHVKHYNSWFPTTQYAVDKAVGGDFLNPNNRINTGCDDMPEVSECKR